MHTPQFSSRLRATRGGLARVRAHRQIGPPLIQLFLPDSFDCAQFVHALEFSVGLAHLQDFCGGGRPDSRHFLQLRGAGRIDVDGMPRRLFRFRADCMRNEENGAAKKKNAKFREALPHRSDIMPALAIYFNNRCKRKFRLRRLGVCLARRRFPLRQRALLALRFACGRRQPQSACSRNRSVFAPR